MKFSNLALLTFFLLFTSQSFSANEPVIDASSEEAVLTSLNEISDVYPDSEKELRRAMNVIARDSMMGAFDTNDAELWTAEDLRKSTAEDFRKKGVEIFLERVDGMTAADIINEMNRIESEER